MPQPGAIRAPTLLPWESSQRAAQVAVDMMVMNVQYMNTLSHFFSDGELFHCQMQLLYGLINVMSATKGIEPEVILDFARGYFEKLRRERGALP